MPETTDRDRLEKLADDRLREKAEAAEKRRQQEADVAAAKAATFQQEQAKTDELLAWCQQTFAGYKLKPSGHEVRVETARSSKMLNLAADHVAYVSLFINHWLHETNDFQGNIPVLMARFKNSRYDIFRGDGQHCFMPNFDHAKEDICTCLP